MQQNSQNISKFCLYETFWARPPKKNTDTVTSLGQYSEGQGRASAHFELQCQGRSDM